jgi:putative acetyltransferase
VASAAGAPRLYLEASSVLGPALSLYRAMGFKQLPRGRPGAPDDARIDIWMERPLP